MRKLISLVAVCMVLVSLMPSAVMAADGGGNAPKTGEGRIELYQKNPATGQIVTGGGQAQLKSLRSSEYLFGNNPIRYEYQPAAVPATMASTAPVTMAAGTGKLVAIFFDDGWQNQYDNALPILQQHGFKATFAVVTSWIGRGSGSGQAMSMSELHQLANQGMDIASHTKTHPHLPNLNSSDLQNEVAGSKTELESAGFTVRAFVYPYFEYNSNVISAVRNAGYIYARSGGLNKPFDPATTNPDDRFTIDTVEISTQNISQFQTIVSQAGEHSVICLCYHSISDNTAAPTPRTPVSNFSEQMLFLKENGFTVVLLRDLIQNPRITSNPASVTFSGTKGSSNPLSQTLNISNSGGGTLNWTASSNVAWLNLSPTSGSSTGSQNPVAVTATIAGLNAGTYNGTITIAATGATNTPQTVPVTLTVKTPSPNWLTGWNYRKQITIAGSTAGAQTNYPMKVNINRSTGTDADSTVYVGTNCASDYKDIRFTKNDGVSLLDYWIESSNSTTATVWVEFDSILASPNTATFNLYYGNSGATSSSNIHNTFTFADDFEDGALDATKWTTGGGTGGSVTEANGVLTVTAGTSNQKYAASINTYNNAYALHNRAKLDSITGCSSYRLIGFVTTKGTYADKNFTSTFRWWHGDPNFDAMSGNGSSVSYADMNVAKDTNYHISECIRYAASGTNYDRFIMDGGTAVSGTKPAATPRYIYINSDEPGKAIIVDWIFLRKYASPEPTWGAWGSEETSTNPLPPPVPILSAPANGSTQAGASVTFTWDASSGATDYDLQIWSSSGTFHDKWLGNVTTKTLAGFPGDGRTFYWRVYPKNAVGVGTPSAVWNFTNGTAPTPPPAPTILAPANGSTQAGTSITFTWNAASGATDYDLWIWSSSGTFFDQWLGNVTSKTVTGFPNDGRIFYWRVYPRSAAGTGTPSTTWNFINGSPPTPPPAPTLSAPANSSTQAGTSITFTWNASTGATDYDLYVYNASGTFFDQWLGNITSKTVTGFPNDGRIFYWRVYPKNAAGIGTPSTTWNFINGSPPTPPPAPTLSAPANSSTQAGTSITFTWTAASGATDYDLWIWSSSGTFFDQWLGNFTSKTVTGFPNDSSTFYWRVYPRSTAGIGTPSTVWNFTNGTPPTPPPPPTLIAATTSSTLAGKSVNFTWNASPGATDYDLLIWSSSGTFFDQWLGNVTTKSVTGFPNDGRTFYWRVYPKNAQGIGTPSAIGSFFAP